MGVDVDPYRATIIRQHGPAVCPKCGRTSTRTYRCDHCRCGLAGGGAGGE